MKRFIFSIVALLAVLTGTYFYSSAATESSLDDLTAYINAYPWYVASTEILEEDLLHTRARLNLNLDTESLFAGVDPASSEPLAGELSFFDKGLDLYLDIYKGPLIFQDGFYPGLYRVYVSVDENIAFLDEMFGSDFNLNDWFSMTVNMNYFGKGDAALLISGIPEQSIGDARINWDGMRQNLRLRDYGKAYTMEGVMQPLRIEGAEGRLEMSTLDFEGEGVFPDAGKVLTQGSYTLSMESLSIISQGRTAFSLEDLKAGARSIIDGELLSMNYLLETGAVGGTELPNGLNQSRLHVGASGLHKESLENLYLKTMDLRTMLDPLQAQTVMMQSLASLFAGNPTYSIHELSFSSGSDTELNLRADISFGENFMSNIGLAFADPAQLLNSIHATLRADFTESVLELAVESYLDGQADELLLDPRSLEQYREQQRLQINAMVLQAVQNGFLLQQGDRYEIDATFENGQLTVNGTTVPLPAMGL